MKSWTEIWKFLPDRNLPQKEKWQQILLFPAWEVKHAQNGVWSGSEWMNNWLNERMSKQGEWCTRLAGCELWLQGSHGLNFPGEAMNMNEWTSWTFPLMEKTQVTLLEGRTERPHCHSGVSSSGVKNRLLESWQKHSHVASSLLSFKLRKLEIKMMISALCAVKDQSLTCSNKLL